VLVLSISTGGSSTGGRRAPRTRKNGARLPPIPDRLLAHLRRWQRRGQRFCVEWNGRPVEAIDKAFRNNAAEAGLPEVTPHTLRHTAATWLMQRGTDLWEAAGFLGTTVEQLERTYGHHHAHHLKGARQALDWRPGSRAEQKAAAPSAHQHRVNKTG
jgi:integrase